ncbi:MAG: SDR family oxidoreductase [Puniceicoccales bacterium]|jgi:NAD(P)-dependent dehydrogenase (short-subunit alcohol dehydrogenase family)|nr:SDR family oxidoreductase [Puniceicoccales bacterium]
MLPIDLAGKRAIVTGASDGIGFGVSQMLAQAGCDIVGTGTVGAESPRAQRFLKTVAEAGRQGHYFSGDIALPETPANIVQEAVSRLGGIDIVVSNAGKNAFHGTADCTEEQWLHNINLNLASHWRLAKAARPYLQQARPGVLIVMGSNHAYNTIPGCFPYNTTKAGILGLVQALAIEWGPEIRTVGVAPGFIDTPGNQAWFDSFPDPAAERVRTEKMHPVGRIGTVEEVGALCAFLASPYGGFINGNTLLMDGGRSALMQDSV